MEATTITLLLIALFSLMAIIYITIYNNIQTHKSKIEKVESLIDEDLRLKFDNMVRADDLIKNNVQNKKDYLKEYRNLKEERISNFELNRKLKEAENIIINLCEDNSSLEKNEKMIEIRHEFKYINEKITAGISYYNNHTNLLNSYIRKFPNNIIAKIHHVKPKTFFDGKDMTDTDINDFKL